MPNDSKQLSYLKRNAARSKDISLLDPNHILPATHDLNNGRNSIEIRFQAVCPLCSTVPLVRPILATLPNGVFSKLWLAGFI